MRRPAWWIFALAAGALVFAFGVFVGHGTPTVFVHPDEQSAALPAMAIVGQTRSLPEDLHPYQKQFQPYNIVLPEEGRGVSTAFLGNSGVGFAYPIYLAPFYLVSPAAAYLSGALALALLYVGALLLLDGRRVSSYFLAGLVLAIPSAVIQADLLFSNLPGLAFFVMGLGFVAEARRAHRPWLVVPALLSMACAAAVRLDYVIGLALGAPLAVGLVVAGLPRERRRRALLLAAGGLLLCVGTAAGVFRLANGTWGLPYLHGRTVAGGPDLGAVWTDATAFIGSVASRNASGAWGMTADNYIFTFVPALAAIGLLFAGRPSVRGRGALLVLPLAAQGLAVWFLTAGVNHYGTGCSCVDASQARYFLPIYAAFALLGALLVRDLAARLPSPRWGTAASALVAGLVVTAGVAHAYNGEKGILWIRGMKDFHEEYARAAEGLPADAVVAGNYLSKIVTARPVLVPQRGGNFAAMVDPILATGHPVFVEASWLRPGVDERGDYGQHLMRSSHHYLVHAGVKEFYEVKRTNASLRGVFDLGAGQWEDARNGTAMRATQDPAYFRSVDRPDGALPLGGVVPSTLHVNVTYLDDKAGRVVTGGYHNFDSNSTVVLGTWMGQGTGKWVTQELVLKPGLVVTGKMFLTGEPTVGRLEVTWT